MDWSKTKPDLVARVVSEGETYLAGQLTLATSSDQRASMLAGVFTAAGTALLVGLITLAVTKDISAAVKYPAYLGGGVAAVLFILAAAFCIMATFPVKFWLPGNQPQSWYGDVQTGKELTPALAEEAEHIQSKIAENRATLQTNATRFKWGAALGIAAPLIGAALWIISSSSLWVAG